jgi:hypothetical protein
MKTNGKPKSKMRIQMKESYIQILYSITVDVLGDWIQLTEDWVQWLGIVSMINNLESIKLTYFMEQGSPSIAQSLGLKQVCSFCDT